MEYQDYAEGISTQHTKHQEHLKPTHNTLINHTAKKEISAKEKRNFCATWNCRFEEEKILPENGETTLSQTDISLVDTEFLSMIFKGIEVG